MSNGQSSSRFLQDADNEVGILALSKPNKLAFFHHHIDAFSLTR
ncbi:MAG: hypothetical protein JWQ21_612 [Herminiimonas sp.]|nr:hypothetical protein [Herminiimonas sp.]